MSKSNRRQEVQAHGITEDEVNYRAKQAKEEIKEGIKQAQERRET